MKKSIFMALAIITIAGLTKTVTAQYKKTVSQTAGAEIVSAISLTSDAPLNFGKMSAPSSDAEVSISTAGIVTTTNLSAISLFPATATIAHYNVSGASGYAYTITLPADNHVKIESGTNSMNVDAFKARTTSNSTADGTSGTLSSGTDTFVVGATLKVKSGQASGTYSGNFDVIVAYN